MTGNIASLIFLSAGLFMGWSLGANDAANIFGTAVGTKMIKFRTAAIISSIFVIIGAATSGYGPAQSLGELGQINAIAGAFTVSGAAALTVTFMTRRGLPVSTSQAIVGAIIGWNLFSGNKTQPDVIFEIIGTWFYAPILAGVFAIIIYLIVKLILKHVKIHIVSLYKYTKYALIIAGAFGAYSLGANNISNVVGVYIGVSPFKAMQITDNIGISAGQQLLIIGGIAIAIGIFTYSGKVMKTVGSGIFDLSPIGAFIAVFASSLVLFLFSNVGLHKFLTTRNLPAFPLVPVSQSQAVVGAIIGIGIAKGMNNISYKQIGKIVIGWILTPLMALIISYVGLAIIQNLFMIEVYL